MPEPKSESEPKYRGAARKALDEVARQTAIIEKGQEAYAARIVAYQKCRDEGVLFSDIAAAAHCTDAAVMTALKKAAQAAS